MRLAFTFAGTAHARYGQPDVTLHPPGADYPTGLFQIYPAGVDGPCLFMSPEDWRQLNNEVEAAYHHPLTPLADSGKMPGTFNYGLGIIRRDGETGYV